MWDRSSDFVTNGYGVFWDSSCEKPWVPVKKKSLKLKMLQPLCNHTVNPKTDSKTLYYSILKLKYSPSILKHNKGEKKYALLNNSHNNCHRNYTNQILLIHMLRLINWSLRPTGRMPWVILHLWGLPCIRDAGGRGNKITALHTKGPSLTNTQACPEQDFKFRGRKQQSAYCLCCL